MPAEPDAGPGPRDERPAPVERSWLEVRAHQARNPPPPVFRAVVANLGVAIVGALVLVAWDWLAARDASLPRVSAGVVAAYVIMVLAVGSLLTYLWVELPTGSPDGPRRRSPWAALLGFFAAVPITYLVLVVALQVVRPMLG